MAARVVMDPGRFWAWAALLVGGGVSLGANIGHSYIPPVGAPPRWSPSGWSLAWAVAGPVLLFFTVKVISLVRWPRGFRWALWRWGAALPVAGLAAYVSWAHISGLLASVGEGRVVRILGPLAVDGLMLVAVGALMATAAGSSAVRGGVPLAPAGLAANGGGVPARVFSPPTARSR